MKAELIKEMFQVNMKIGKIRQKFFETNNELARSEFVLLDYVIELEKKDEKQTISQVAVELQLSNAAVSRTIKQLLAKGWLVRETLEEDRRNGIVKISKEGRTIFDRLNAQLNAEVEKDFADVSVEEIEKFLKLGKKIISEVN